MLPEIVFKPFRQPKNKNRLLQNRRFFIIVLIIIYLNQILYVTRVLPIPYIFHQSAQIP